MNIFDKTPYLEWNNKTWELGENYKNDDKAKKWLTKNIDNLPKPLYHLGWTVEFKWMHPPLLVGEIRRIGFFDVFDPNVKNICYSIYANGHARSIFANAYDKIVSDIVRVIKY